MNGSPEQFLHRLAVQTGARTGARAAAARRRMQLNQARMTGDFAGQQRDARPHERVDSRNGLQSLIAGVDPPDDRFVRRQSPADMMSGPAKQGGKFETLSYGA
jgi:hypothetical protein